MNIQFILNKIKLEREIYSDAELAKIFDVSPAAVSNWKARQRMPMSVIQRYCNENNTQITDYISPVLKTKTRQKQTDIKNLNEKVSIKDDNIEITRDLEMVDAKYIIDLQKDKIEQQQRELVMLKNVIENQPLQKMKFDDVQADMETTVEIKNIFSLKPTERKVSKAEGYEKIAKIINIESETYKNKFLSVGNWHLTDKHPVDEVIDKDTLKELKKMTRNLPTVLDSLKWVAGLHYMVIPVRYVYQGAYCNTICYLLLDWKSKPVKVLSKSIIINGVEN
jgi:predicted transcriptional regulator